MSLNKPKKKAGNTIISTTATLKRVTMKDSIESRKMDAKWGVFPNFLKIGLKESVLGRKNGTKKARKSS